MNRTDRAIRAIADRFGSDDDVDALLGNQVFMQAVYGTIRHIAATERQNVSTVVARLLVVLSRRDRLSSHDQVKIKTHFNQRFCQRYENPKRLSSG